jgi:HEAT repeat protein
MAVPVELSHSARLRAAAERYGQRDLAERAAALLLTGDEDAEFLQYLGGRAAPPDSRYWAQSWGARALEYYWVEGAATAVAAGLSHEHWRVRMVCSRVCAVRELGIPERLAELTNDENWRVRDAAAWALGAVGEFEHSTPLRNLMASDVEPRVRARAEGALVAMSVRLDRPLDDLLLDD